MARVRDLAMERELTRMSRLAADLAVGEPVSAEDLRWLLEHRKAQSERDTDQEG